MRRELVYFFLTASRWKVQRRASSPAKSNAMHAMLTRSDIHRSLGFACGHLIVLIDVAVNVAVSGLSPVFKVDAWSTYVASQG